MLLKLIKQRSMYNGIHAELTEYSHIWGEKHLADVFVLHEHMPQELIYPVHVTRQHLFIRRERCDWQWECDEEENVRSYLAAIQMTREEIYLEICEPEPDLPGYPYTDYHPDDYPTTIGLDDIPEEEFDELIYEMDD